MYIGRLHCSDQACFLYTGNLLLNLGFVHLGNHSTKTAGYTPHIAFISSTCVATAVIHEPVPEKHQAKPEKPLHAQASGSMLHLTHQQP